MADAVIQTSSRSSPSPQVNRGPMGSLLFGLLNFGAWLILGLFGNIVMEWLGMSVLWPEQGVGRSRQLLDAEIQMLQQALPVSLLTEQPTRFAVNRASELHQLLFQQTGLVQAMTLSQQVQTPEAQKAEHKPQSRFSQFRHKLLGSAPENFKLVVASM